MENATLKGRWEGIIIRQSQPERRHLPPGDDRTQRSQGEIKPHLKGWEGPSRWRGHKIQSRKEWAIKNFKTGKGLWARTLEMRWARKEEYWWAVFCSAARATGRAVPKRHSDWWHQETGKKVVYLWSPLGPGTAQRRATGLADMVRILEPTFYSQRIKSYRTDPRELWPLTLGFILNPHIDRVTGRGWVLEVHIPDFTLKHILVPRHKRHFNFRAILHKHCISHCHSIFILLGDDGLVDLLQYFANS